MFFSWNRLRLRIGHGCAHVLDRARCAGMVCVGKVPTHRDSATTPSICPPKLSNQAELITRAARRRCQRCSRKAARRSLIISPIDLDPTNTDPTNLVALCAACHARRQKEYNFLKKQALAREEESSVASGMDLWRSLPGRRPSANLLLLPVIPKPTKTQNNPCDPA